MTDIKTGSVKIYLDSDIQTDFDFDHEKIAMDVCEAVLKRISCPFDTEIDILIVDDERIREINLETRDIDNATDVLSFPNLFFADPGKFDIRDEELSDLIDPENGLIVLGEIVLSYDRILAQSTEYGHSIKREYAFLIAHSMLHLCGYDHMTDEDAVVMEDLQKQILDGLKIFRE